MSVLLYAAVLLLRQWSPEEAVPGGGAPARPALAAHLAAAGGGGLRHAALGYREHEGGVQKQQLYVIFVPCIAPTWQHEYIASQPCEASEGGAPQHDQRVEQPPATPSAPPSAMSWRQQAHTYTPVQLPELALDVSAVTFLQPGLPSRLLQQV